MAEKEKFLSIAKMDAARRQLDTALLLYFNQADVVAVHTLTASAHGVLRDLSLKSGTQMLIEGSLLQGIGPEFTQEVLQAMRTAQNFFKHADRDADAILRFSPQSTDLLLLDAAAKYLEMTGEQTILQRAFEKWFVVHYPQFWNNTKMARLARESSRLFGGMERQEFLRNFLVTAAELANRKAAG